MISYIWARGVAWPLLTVLVVGVAGFTVGRHRGTRWPNALMLATAWLSVAIIPALTLTRDGLPRSLHLDGAFQWANGGAARFTTTFGHSEEIWLNIILFVPAAAAVTLLRHSPVPALVGGFALSVCVEVIQGVLQLGLPDAADVTSNTCGAIGGAVIGTLFLTARPLTRRRGLQQTSVLLAALAVAALCIPPLAARKQDRIVTAARQTFANRDIGDYHRWTENGTLGTRVFDLQGVFSDGARDNGHVALVRYPSSFMGVEQCIIARWTRTGMHPARHSGSICSTFWG